MRPPAIFERILPGDVAGDSPLLSLIAVNLVTILLAILEGWDPATVMFVYWAQSIIIGIFTVVSILGADTPALAEDMEKPFIERGGKGIGTRFVVSYKVFLAGFFCVHYGLFHWAYYSFIVESGIFGPVHLSDPGIYLSCGLFFINHLYSHVRYRHQGSMGAAFITEEFFSPYRRIIPMHLTIIFGGIIVLVLQLIGIESTLPVLLLFLVLKTYSDISAHIAKHLEEKHPGTPVRYL